MLLRMNISKVVRLNLLLRLIVLELLRSSLVMEVVGLIEIWLIIQFHTTCIALLNCAWMVLTLFLSHENLCFQRAYILALGSHNVFMSVTHSLFSVLVGLAMDIMHWDWLLPQCLLLVRVHLSEIVNHLLDNLINVHLFCALVWNDHQKSILQKLQLGVVGLLKFI